jgi:hypothetical protein
VTFFQPQKTPRKGPQLHHKNTTTSPQKTIDIPTTFPQPPSKNSAKSPKSTPPPQQIFFSKSRKMLHLNNDNAGQALSLFAQHAVAY